MQSCNTEQQCCLCILLAGGSVCGQLQHSWSGFESACRVHPQELMAYILVLGARLQDLGGRVVALCNVACVLAA